MTLTFSILANITHFTIAACIILTICAIYFYAKYNSAKFEINALKKQKELFLSALNHDMKVAAIAQVRAMEIFPKLNKDEQDEIFSELEKSNNYSLEMIEMLSDIFKIDEKEYKVNFEDIKLQEIIENSVKENKSAIEEKNLTANIKISDSAQSVVADKKSIKKVVAILLNTAISRANKNSSIAINAQQINDKIKISLEYSCTNRKNNEYLDVLEENPQFSTVGHCIKLQLCKKLLALHNTSLTTVSTSKSCCSLVFILNKAN